MVATRKRKALSVSAPLLRQIAKGGNYMARWQNQPNTEKREQVISLRMSGMTYKQIASAIGHKNESWVMTVCRENGLGGTSAWKDKRYAEMREYKAQGHTIAEVAERFGVSDATATKVCKGIAPQKCDYAEVSKKLKGRYIPLIHEQTAERLKTLLCDEFEWAGGYTCSTGYVTIRCKQCGAEFERSAQAIRKQQVKNCPCCVQQKAEQRERELEERRIMREAQEEARRRDREQKERERSESIRQVDCVVCGKRFETRKPNKLCCSQECSRKYTNRHHDKRIAKDKRVDFGINARSLYKRDKGVCWICGGQCDLNDYITKNGYFVAGDWYPSVDHIVPICDGGEDSWENVKLAHRSCNTRRYIDEKTSRLKKSV